MSVEVSGPHEFADEQIEAAASAGQRVQRALSSPSLRLVAHRLLIAIPVLCGVTFLTFIVMNALPGDAATELLGVGASPQEYQAVEARMHLNQPVLARYWEWLVGLLHGNLGTSLDSQQSVAQIVGQRLPLSVGLVAFAFVLSVVFAIPVALLAARRPGGIADRISLLVSMAGLSIAPFVLALVLILVFAVKLQVLPALYPSDPGGFFGTLKDLLLPAISFAFPLFCVYTRFLRAEIVDQLRFGQHIVAARAKGLSELRILVHHALANSLLGFITIIGLNVGTLIAGTVVVEEIFAVPGLGSELLSAISNRDLPIIQGIVLVFACFTVGANLLADLLYTVIDPRIRYGSPRV